MALLIFELRLNLLTQAGNGDAEHLAVLGNRATSYAVTFGVKDIHKIFVGKRVTFVFVINALLEQIFNLVA